MSFYLKVASETLAEALENHFYKKGYSTVDHAVADAQHMLNVGESFEVYGKGETDMDADNHFVTVDGVEYQRYFSGTKS